MDDWTWAGRPVTNEADRGRRRSFSWLVVGASDGRGNCDLPTMGVLFVDAEWPCREVNGRAPFVESPLIAEYVSRHFYAGR